MRASKKIMSVLLVVVCMMCLMACGDSTGKTGVCVYEKSGVEITITMEAGSDNLVNKMTQTSIVDVSKYSDEQIENIYIASAQAREAYEQIDGVEYAMEEKKDKMIETIVMDLSKEGTLQALAENNMLPVEGDTTAISLEKTMESLESQGWTIKEQ